MLVEVFFVVNCFGFLVVVGMFVVCCVNEGDRSFWLDLLVDCYVNWVICGYVWVWVSMLYDMVFGSGVLCL